MKLAYTFERFKRKILLKQRIRKILVKAKIKHEYKQLIGYGGY